MRGTRAKALRTDDRPNPGRKHGGAVNPQQRGPVLPAPLFRGHAIERRSRKGPR